MFTLYDNSDSGNAHKARLILRMLSLPHRTIEMDTLGGATRTEEFLRKNRNGRIPVLELEDGRLLPESNAILFYLSQGTPLWPTDKWAQAVTLQWMFFEQYSHEPFIAVLRNWTHSNRLERFAHQVEEKRAGGYAALDVMEDHLSRACFFSGGAFGIADIALYAYTHVAHEGGFDLVSFHRIQDWLRRVSENVEMRL